MPTTLPTMTGNAIGDQILGWLGVATVIVTAILTFWKLVLKPGILQAIADGKEIAQAANTKAESAQRIAGEGKDIARNALDTANTAKAVSDIAVQMGTGNGNGNGNAAPGTSLTQVNVESPKEGGT